MTLQVALRPPARHAIRELARESQDGRETGGILLGRGPNPAGVVEIIQAGDPGPNAIRCADRFMRDLEHAQRLAHDAWETHAIEWIGEWHTHPTSGPTPSQRDLTTYVELLRDENLGFSIFVSVIVTPDPDEGWNEPTLTTWVLAPASA